VGGQRFQTRNMLEEKFREPQKEEETVGGNSKNKRLKSSPLGKKKREFGGEACELRDGGAKKKAHLAWGGKGTGKKGAHGSKRGF